MIMNGYYLYLSCVISGYYYQCKIQKMNKKKGILLALLYCIKKNSRALYMVKH